jgi:U3 small nucleolar ribonucleoprotein protein IMP3
LKLKALKKSDEYRIKKTKELLDKLYQIGFINNQINLKDANSVGISTFCRRRLAYILFRNKYCESIKQAVTYIEQGQIRVGTEVITDPAYLVTRGLEDHITWSNNSKIKRKIMEYNGQVDDYELID